MKPETDRENQGHSDEQPGTDKAKRPGYEEMLPEDLPIIEEGLAEASEAAGVDPNQSKEQEALARRLIERPPPSAMVSRAGRWMRFVAKMIFAHVLFERRYVDAIRDTGARGPIIYVLKSRSRLDYLYFNYAFLEHGLPLAAWANDISIRPFRRFFGTLGNLFRRQKDRPECQLEALVSQGNSAFLFLERPRQDDEEAITYSQSYLYRLVRLQRAQEEPIYVVPLLLVWEKRPEPWRASFLDDIFGTVQSPGFFRKFLHYFQTFWQSFLRFGQPMAQVSTPINLRDFLREYPKADSSDASELLRSRLEDFIRRERRVILGPTALPKEEIHREVLQRPELTEQIRLIAEAESVPETTIRKRAKSQLEEISADQSLLMLKFFSATLSFVWYRIYEGFEIDEEGLEEVREALKTSSVVLVPSHKSHIDYLVLSYVFYHYGLMCPHIAAGVNLSFWPMGPIFRRAGAFFLRRSFKGDELYPVIFREYLIRLMKESYPIEFFIEGTRSRTGKLIKPRYGMLDMMVRAFAEGRLESVKFVPISVGYEKIIEERTYRRELLGEEKQKESLAGLLKTPKFLTSKKGRLYVEFDEPIDLGEYFARYSIDRLEPDEEELSALTVRLAHRIIYDINQITTVSPAALTAAALLNTPARSLERTRLLHEVGFLIHFLTQPGRKVRLSGALREALASREPELAAVRTRLGKEPPVSLGLNEQEKETVPQVEPIIGQAVASVIDRAIEIFEGEAQIELREEAGEVFYTLEEERRTELAIYRNMLVQHFVPEGLLATAIMRFDEPQIDLQELMEETHFLSRLFKYEWIYEERAEFENVFRRTLDYFEASKWISRIDDEDRDREVVQILGAGEELTYFRRMVLSFLEAYAIVTGMLDELQGGRMESREFVKAALQRGRKGYLRGDILFYESISKPTFINALRLLEDWGAVQRQQEAGRVRETTYYSLNPEWAAEQYWHLQKRIDAFVYRDWEMRNRIAGRRSTGE